MSKTIADADELEVAGVLVALGPELVTDSLKMDLLRVHLLHGGMDADIFDAALSVARQAFSEGSGVRH